MVGDEMTKWWMKGMKDNDKNNVERNGDGKRMIGDEIVMGKTIGDEMVIKGRNDDEKVV
ncbi:18936_t:CDS:2 [Rhizophagus irregularis]|nr:18936_t:CDS:2 [Rhizophagus irregularis]